MKKEYDDSYERSILAEKLPAFKAELKTLLEKYDACIGGQYKVDTHGIYDEEFVVQFGCPMRKQDRGRLYTKEAVLNPNNMYLSAYDMKDL